MLNRQSTTQENIVKENLKNSVLITDLGYKITKQKIELDSLAGESLETTLSNSIKQRSVDYSFTQGQKNDPFFLIYVINDRGNGSFNLATYMKKHKIKTEKNPFHLNSYPGDFQDQVEAFMQTTNKILQEHLSDILSGARWENVDFDWHGYK